MLEALLQQKFAESKQSLNKPTRADLVSIEFTQEEIDTALRALDRSLAHWDDMLLRQNQDFNTDTHRNQIRSLIDRFYPHRSSPD